MSAIILVLNTPYFTKTAMNGSFELNVPPGEYDLSVFHERATEQELSGLERRVIVPESGLRRRRLRSLKPVIWSRRTRTNTGTTIRLHTTIRCFIRG
jgi:hypothetical protein